MTTMYSSDDRKKNRISAIFGSRKSHENMHGRPSLSPAPGANGNSADSAYASSDPPSQHTISARASPENRHANMVSIENNGQINGVDGSRHLQLNRKTGEISDEATGEVVTTVTTTTTTTTTTVRKGAPAAGAKGTTVQVDTQPGHVAQTSNSHPGIAEAPGDGPSSRQLQPQHEDPRDYNRSPIPAPLQVGRQPQQPQQYAEPQTVSPPHRNPDRKSREYGRPPSPLSPVTQGRHNFSYPSRAGTKSTEHLPQMPPEQPAEPVPGTSSRGSSGAFENLKLAAIGLHGVGETLRGTLNSEVDNRLSRRNPDKAAAVNAKNRADIERGQAEMARLRERNGLAPTISRPGHDPVSMGQQQLQQPQQQRPSSSGRVSQQAPQIPPMGTSGAAGGKPASWDAPGTWGSGRVGEMKAPQTRTQEVGVHPALRGPGPGPGPQPQPQSQQQQPPPQPSYGAPAPPQSRSNDPAQPGGQFRGMQPRISDESAQPRYPGSSGGRAPVPGSMLEPDADGMGSGIAGSGHGPGGGANAAARVQAVSHVQGNSSAEPEEEKKSGGLRKLFKRKGVGGS
ncbi:hypothetical protein LTR53_010354 [Teratosphaeriaceae sp. CCFEE 6253]|nr:hypothetical protein LTR53_010354 [Teratosphaeriaceae sp. CCFEE 6253]